MIEAVQYDLAHRFNGQKTYIRGAYTCTEEEAAEWKQELEEAFPGYEIILNRLSLSVTCHIGAGSVAVTCMREVAEAGEVAFQI